MASTFTVNCLTPAEVVETVTVAGTIKGNMRLDKVFFSGVSAGCLLAFACATVLSTNTAPWWQENAPGLMRTIAALVFPYGLCMIILTGADLCTGSFMVRLLRVSCTITQVLTADSSPPWQPSSVVSPGTRC